MVKKLTIAGLKKIALDYRRLRNEGASCAGEERILWAAWAKKQDEELIAKIHAGCRWNASLNAEIANHQQCLREQIEQVVAKNDVPPE